MGVATQAVFFKNKTGKEAGFVPRGGNIPAGDRLSPQNSMGEKLC
jgi:hypothetical protein